jgi:hypothetical protein|tara:strand:+ start:1779 stop:2372 length:594 start_codon:yes stop_codon:yes gene_type:complete
MSALLVKDKEITMELTAEIVRELLYYNPNTGKLFWKERSLKYFKSERFARRWNTRYAGKEAFITKEKDYSSKHGRIRRKVGTIFEIKYYAHRIIWLHYYGCWPKDQIDHINHDATDNRIINLREVSGFENQKNRTLQKNSTTGYTGVTWHKTNKKYTARIKVNNKDIHLGSYDNLEEAIKARELANINYNFHPNHGK